MTKFNNILYALILTLLFLLVSLLSYDNYLTHHIFTCICMFACSHSLFNYYLKSKIKI